MFLCLEKIIDFYFKHLSNKLTDMKNSNKLERLVRGGGGGFFSEEFNQEN